MLNAFSGPLGWLAVGSAAVFVIGLLYWRVRASGARAAREKQLRADVRAVEVRHDHDDEVAGREPSENRERFGKWAK